MVVLYERKDGGDVKMKATRHLRNYYRCSSHIR